MSGTRTYLPKSASSRGWSSSGYTPSYTVIKFCWHTEDMGTDFVPLICYYDGELQLHTGDPVYVGGDVTINKVRKNIGFTELVHKLHELCKSSTRITTIDIKCRYILDQRTAIAMHVKDDNSLSIIMDLHPHQCNAIVVYVEKRPVQNPSTTILRNERDFSSTAAGNRNYIADTPEEANVSPLLSNGNEVNSIVIDVGPSSSKCPSFSRDDKLKLEKEVEIVSPKLHKVNLEAFNTTAAVADKNVVHPVRHLSKDFAERSLIDPDVPLSKFTERSKVRLQDPGTKRYVRLMRQFPKNDATSFEILRTYSNSWSGMRILDPNDPYLQRWNKIFVLVCMLALALDAFFLYTPGTNTKMNCLKWDRSLEITVSVLRSLTDIILIARIIFQFRTGFIAPSSQAFGRGEFVEDLGVIAKRYLYSFFMIDFLAVLPLPQVLILIIFPQVGGSLDLRRWYSLRYVILLQYLPRFLRIYPLYKELRNVNAMSRTAWAGAVMNFSLYMLASHVYGAYWYFLSVERVSICWRDICRNTATCDLYSLSCGDHHTIGYELLHTSCPIIEPNTTIFDFGIYLDVLQSGVPKSSFPDKLMYCFWWGLQNLGSFGQNLKTSAYIWEVCFAVSFSIFGLFLFMLLIGNVQIYLQSDTVKSEKNLRKKLQDTEKWMSRKFLPKELRQRIRQYELYNWQITRGFEEENLLENLPKDIKRDVKRHLCLPLLLRVPLFEKLDEELLDALCDYLKPVLYTEDSLILRKGDPVNEMLFITRGELLGVALGEATNGGKSPFLNSWHLSAGDFFGEELLAWATNPRSSSVPISTITVESLKKVEAFSLSANDLKSVLSQFSRLDRKRLLHTVRYYSEQWRTWAACYIQRNWRRYRSRRLTENTCIALANNAEASSSRGSTNASRA